MTWGFSIQLDLGFSGFSLVFSGFPLGRIKLDGGGGQGGLSQAASTKTGG